MARSLGALTLDVIAKIGKFIQPLNQAEGAANKFSKNVSKGNKAASDSFSALASRIAGPLAAALSVRQVAAYADEWTNLSNRLKLVTDSSQQLAMAQGDVFSIAQETRQSLQSSAELYQRIATNAENLGLSLSDVSGVVKSISQTLVISGASAQSANAALVQLGQAFASGTLRGEELNSVMEQAPALARAIADGLDVPIGRLREMGKAGELTSAQVIGALQKMQGSIDEDFQKTQGTIAQGFVQIGNAAVALTGKLDSLTGTSGLAYSALSSFAELLTGFAQAGTAEGRIRDLEEMISDLSETLGTGLSGTWIGDIVDQSTLDKIAELRVELIQLRAEREILASQKPVEIGVEFDMAALKTQFEQAGQAVEQYGKEAEKAAKKSNDAYKNQVTDYQRQIELINATTEAERVRFETSQGGFAALDPAQKQNLQNLAAEVDVLQKRKELNESYKGQVEQYQQQIALTGEVTEAERVRYETTKGSLSELDAAQKKHLESLAAEADAAKELAELNATYAGQVDSYEREIALMGELTELEKIRYEIASGSLQGIDAAQQQKLEGLAAEKDALEENAQLEQDLASLTSELATEEEKALQKRNESLALLSKANEEQLAALGGLAEAHKRVFDQYDEDMEKANEATSEMSEFAKQAARNMQDAFADFLFDPFADGLDGMLSSFGKILQRMAAEATAAAVFDSLGAAFGGGGGSGGGFADLFAGFFDTGGMIGSGQFGIVGERGPEIVRGPAMVTSRQETARMMGGTNNINITTGARNRQEALEAGGAIARQVARAVGASQRYQ